MKKLLLHISLFFSLIGFSQNEQLAQYYYDKGDFEKAKISYESLLGAQPYNSLYFQRVVECQQQLQDFQGAEKNLLNRSKQYQQASLLVELGYNYQLQKQGDKASKLLSKIEAAYNKEETEMMVRLIKIRESLWT